MSKLKIPLSITGKKELIKVQREIEHLREEIIQTKITGREIGRPKPLPTPSEVTNEFLFINDLTLGPNNIEDVIKQLEHIRDTAPVLRVSFASEPDLPVLTKLVGWFRNEIDKNALIQVGIQPSIAGGAIVQTRKNRYDFSLRRHINGSADKFREAIHKAVFEKQAAEQEPVGTAESEALG